MLTAQNSWGTRRGLGAVLPSAVNLAKASMIEAKSVPAFPKKYFTPIVRSNSRYAWAVFSIEMVFRVAIRHIPAEEGGVLKLSTGLLPSHASVRKKWDA